MIFKVFVAMASRW